MNELAALTPSVSDGFVLPPLSDVRCDDELDAADVRVRTAEEAIADARWDDAVAALDGAAIPPALLPDVALRALLAESWARMSRGELDAALELLATAKQVALRPGFTDLDRAEVLFRIGCVRVQRSSLSRAVNDFSLALELAERSGRACDRLRAEILEWRSRCYQRQRDPEAARADVEHALELTEGIGDELTAAHVNSRASAIAKRNGQWLLARFYAEKARELYAVCGDEPNVGRLLNTLGGLESLLGNPEAAVASLTRAVSIALDVGSDLDAAYAMSSLAQVHLKTGDSIVAEPHARQAVQLLEDRVGTLEELGNVQLVLGRSLLEQGREDEAEEWFDAAEASLAAVEGPNLVASAWLAQGELASARGDAERAARLYRRAAESLQDVNF
jgi:tetratricopeptide (TPR) repeat protein